MGTASSNTNYSYEDESSNQIQNSDFLRVRRTGDGTALLDIRYIYSKFSEAAYSKKHPGLQWSLLKVMSEVYRKHHIKKLEDMAAKIDQEIEMYEGKEGEKKMTLRFLNEIQDHDQIENQGSGGPTALAVSEQKLIQTFQCVDRQTINFMTQRIDNILLTQKFGNHARRVEESYIEKNGA